MPPEIQTVGDVAQRQQQKTASSVIQEGEEDGARKNVKPCFWTNLEDLPRFRPILGHFGGIFGGFRLFSLFLATFYRKIDFSCQNISIGGSKPSDSDPGHFLPKKRPL